jgi:hypothetical protein
VKNCRNKIQSFIWNKLYEKLPKTNPDSKNASFLFTLSTGLIDSWTKDYDIRLTRLHFDIHDINRLNLLKSEFYIIKEF